MWYTETGCGNLDFFTKKYQLTSLGLLAGSNDFSEQMLDVSLSSEPSSNGLLTLRLRGELFCEKERSILLDVSRKQKILSVEWTRWGFRQVRKLDIFFFCHG